MIIGLFDANEESIAYPAAGLPVRRASRESIPPHVVVLFGGDLARRKLLPGL